MQLCNSGYGRVSQDIRDAKIVTVFTRSQCDIGYWQYMFIQSENAALDLDDPPFTFSFLWNIYLLAEMICSRSFNWMPSKAPHHNQCGLKRLMNNFCKTCEDFNLTISIHKQMLRDKISHFHIISQSMACNRQLKKNQISGLFDLR